MTASLHVMVELSRLQAVLTRDVWPNEAYDFTPWLRDNKDHLEAVLGIAIDITATEHPVGGFRLDMLGLDLTHGVPLVVENQLDVSDQSHLGQLITYAAGVEAATVVWVAGSFRDEHARALEWLNASTNEDVRFFGVAIRVVRIGESMAAPNFDLVVSPSEWQKELKALASPRKTKVQVIDQPTSPWEPGDVTLMAEIWAKLTEAAVTLFSRLLASPGSRVSSDDLAQAVGLAGSYQVAGTLSWPGIHCRRAGKDLFFHAAKSPDGQTVYWIDPGTADLIKQAQSVLPA